jgi:prolyl 4-hydroxylase
LNYNKINRIVERLGLSDENSEYIYPEVIDNFITNEQNKYILEKAIPNFESSQLSGWFNKLDTNVRNSKTAWISKDDPVIKEIFLKVCNKYNYPFENCEDLQVVKYEKDNFYKEHHDSFLEYDPGFLMEGGHRVLTALVYLNNDFEAGETRFVNLDKNIKPAKNSCIVFRPLDAECKRCHPKALHAGLPVKSGIKYICNIWIREEPFKYNIDTSIYTIIYDYLLNSTIVYTCSIINSLVTLLISIPNIIILLISILYDTFTSSSSSSTSFTESSILLYDDIKEEIKTV